MSWTTLLDNPKPITTMFGTAPTLNKIDLHEITLHRDGPRVELRFDLSTFPVAPPAKWRAFDRAQLRLTCIGIERYYQDGWRSSNVVDLILHRGADGSLQIMIDAPDLKVTIKFRALVFGGISAYRAGS